MGLRVARGLVLSYALASAAGAGLAGAQQPSGTSLVVVIRNDKEYHQPGCPLVAKAGASVQIMKLAEASRRGLAAHDCEGALAEQPKKDANQAAVFVQADDQRYHKAGCAKLGASATKTTLGEAGRKYWPCPTCRPPIRQRESK